MCSTRWIWIGVIALAGVVACTTADPPSAIAPALLAAPAATGPGVLYFGEQFSETQRALQQFSSQETAAPTF